MIALDYPRERMLADIGASPEGIAPDDFVDPASLADLAGLEEGRLCVSVHRPDEILPHLGAALEKRFHGVERERLARNLLRPLKKAVGNAYKRGNLCSPDKCLRLAVVVTRAGVFIEVSDEGEGFDVSATYARFCKGTRYFAHGGSGFRKFEKARAIVSFADHGATTRLCYRSDGTEPSIGPGS